jgi:hypothetical protein
MTLTNSTVSGNTNAGSTASIGGGIRAEGALSLTNCTIANNTSSGNNPFGGGVSLGNGGTLATRNTIFSNNIAPQGPDIFGTINSLGYNLISNTTNTIINGITTGNVLGQPAQLVALMNNGGPTPTHALMTGSPAINAGDSCVMAAGGCGTNDPLTAFTTDQRGPGFPRQSGVQVDIGAFEVQFPCPSISVTNPATSMGITGVAFSQTFTQTGGIGAITFSTTSTLPTGLTLSSAGVLSGTPTQTGTFPIVVRATDISTCFGGSATYSLVISCQNNPVVTTNADNGAGSLREAIAIACPGSVITFANTVVSPISLTSGELVINKNLTIQGPGVDMMTVDGVGERVFNIAAGSYDVTITDLTITNGVASGADPASPGGFGGNGRGGGLFNQSTGTVNITNCLFRTNYAIGGDGGAVAGGSGGAGMGGAIYQANGGTLQITQTSFFGNEATGGNNDNSGGSGSNNNGLGGAIYNASNATVRVTDCTIAFSQASGGLSGSGNGGRGNGGGIYNVAGTVIVSRSIFETNSANGGNTNFGNRAAGQGAGAGIYNETGMITVSNSTFSANAATGGNTGGSPGTNGAGNGGGLFNASTGAVTLINVTFSVNNAEGGNSGGSPANGTGQGGGIHNASTGVVNVLNTISADNMASTNHPDVFGTFASLGYNLIQTVGAATGFTATGDQTGVNAMLGPLANEGGPTNIFPLLPGSPAINAANNCVLTANGCGNGNPALTTDQRGTGFPRSSGTGVDIGAFEVACQPSTAMLSGSPTICAGTSTTLSITVSGGIAPYTVTLTNGGGTQTGNAPTLTFNVNPAVTTTYAIASATDAIGCPTTASGSATVTVNQLPLATAGAAQIICQGATTPALGGNTPPTGTVGQWTSNSGGTFSNATSPSATWTPPSNFTGTAQLTWTVSSPTNCGTTQTANVQVTVNATPVASAGSAQIICQGATTAALGGNTPPTGTVGQWTSNSGGAFSNATSPSATWTPPSNFNGIAQLTWTVSSPTNCGTAATANVQVTVNATPVATAGAAQIICQGATTPALGGNTPPTGTVGQWTSNSGGSFSPNANDPNATWTPAANFTGMATLTWTVSSPTNCGVPATATVQVTVNATPVASAGSAQIICQGATTAALGGNTPPTGTVGQWTSNSGGAFSNATSPSATWTPPSNFNGIAQLTWTVSSPTNCGTAATANVQVTVNATPVASAGSAQIICQGATTTALGGNTPPIGTTGAWTSNSGGAFSNATSPSATWTPPSNFTGIAQLTWTVSSPTNCGTAATANVQVTVNATPVASAGSAQTICQAATTAALGGNTLPFGTVGQWTSNSGGSFNPNANDPNATWTPTANFTGTATLTWTVSSPTNCGTAQTATVQVTVAGAPTVTDPVNQNVLQGGTATFTVTASGTVQWQVSVNNGPFTNLPGATNATLTLPNVTAAMSGNRYRAVVTSSCNVTATSNPATLFVSVYGGQVTDPLVCTGPGNIVQVTLVITNSGNVSQAVTDTTTFTNLVGIPGSCVASPNVGTCTITNAALNYAGTLAAGQTVTLTYLTQVSNTAATGAQVCSNNTVTFPNSTPITFSVCDVVDCPASGPGNALPAAAEMSDQKAGSVLIYNVYTSSTDPTKQNTRLNLTNTHPTLPAYVHLFFVAEGCSVADSYVCLTANQTTSFLASDLDPGTTGYLVAVAVDGIRGCPTNFNYLIGDEYVKFASGHAANLGAESFAAIAGGLPACDGQSVTAQLNFDGISYNRAPAVLALSNVGSRADGNDTLLILNRIGGNLGTGAATLGTLFGVFYDDAENALSFSVAGNCQLRNSITNNFPRTTPRFESFIPAGRTGWLKDIQSNGNQSEFPAQQSTSTPTHQVPPEPSTKATTCTR